MPVELGPGTGQPERNLNEDLISAAGNQDVNRVRSLLAAGANADYRNARGMDALGSARAYGYDNRSDQIVTLLNKALAERKVVIRPGENLNARLLQSSQAGDIAAVRALLAAGANVNTTNEAKATPLMLAASVAKVETVQALLAAGADVNARNQLGNTALYLAKVAQSLGQLENAREVIDLLRNAGARE